MDFAKLFATVKADVVLTAAEAAVIMPKIALYVQQIETDAAQFAAVSGNALLTGPQKLAAVLAMLKADFEESLPKVFETFDTLKPIFVSLINALVAGYKIAQMFGFKFSAPVTKEIAKDLPLAQAVAGALAGGGGGV